MISFEVKNTYVLQQQGIKTGFIFKLIQWAYVL